MDTKNTESMRGGTPRSKHSATEQRRRSKINDRFQMLRDLVPHSDQKRDKASFLLEVTKINNLIISSCYMASAAFILWFFLYQRALHVIEIYIRQPCR